MCSVEACYPTMERSRGVNLAAYTGAALAGVLLTCAGSGAPPASSAYLPMPLAAAVSGNHAAFLLAALAAFVVPFAGSVVALKATAGKGKARSNKAE